MIIAKRGPLPTEASPLSSDIVIRRQKGGPKCNPETPLRQRLTLYGVSVVVPNLLEDKLIRSVVQQGRGLNFAYRAVGISDLIPPPTLGWCAEQVFKSGGPGSQTCEGFLNCLENYLWNTGRLVVPQIGPLLPEPVPAEEAEPIVRPPEPTLPEEVPVMPLPGIRPGPSEQWLDWIDAVARRVPEIPPPKTPLVRADGVPGPPDEWLAWIRTVAPLVPEMPPPEPIPEAELLPDAEPPEGIPGEEPLARAVVDRRGLGVVGVVGGFLAAIFLMRWARGGS